MFLNAGELRNVSFARRFQCVDVCLVFFPCLVIYLV